MNYRFKNIGDVKRELKNQLRLLEKNEHEICSHLNNMTISDQGVKKIIKLQTEVMTIMKGKAKLLPNNKRQLMFTFQQIIIFVIEKLENDGITDKTIKEDQVLFNKIAELSYYFESLYKKHEEHEEQFMLFENIRNLLRNLVGILLGDWYISFNQMTVPAFHITFDFKTMDREKITNKTLIKKFIEKTIKSIDMNILHGPNIMEGCPENPGLTGFAVIDFSHVAIHTFVLPHSLENEVFMDIFSCKTYDKEKVIQSIKKEFNVEDDKVNYEVLSFGE